LNIARLDNTTVSQEDWQALAGIAHQAPPGLLDWLAEPGLLTARVRELCGDDMRFRMLGPLRPGRLTANLQARLAVVDRGCLLREIEFCRRSERLIFAQTIFPHSTVAAFPWLRELGEAPLGEALRRAEVPLVRDPLEYRALERAHALARAARGEAAASATDDEDDAVLWARRAVYRLAGLPMLVQEVFLPGLLRRKHA
jgi:chorismate--pyruvate lyase